MDVGSTLDPYDKPIFENDIYIGRFINHTYYNTDGFRLPWMHEGLTIGEYSLEDLIKKGLTSDFLQLSEFMEMIGP